MCIRDSKLSIKNYVLFPSSKYICDDEHGWSEGLTNVIVNPFGSQAEKMADIEKAGGFKKVKVIFWKETQTENVQDKLKKLFK